MSDEAVTNIHKPVPPASNRLLNDRIEQFMELTYGDGMLAFTRKEAEVLAGVSDVDEVMIGKKKDEKKLQRYVRPLHVSKVRKMLEAGCHPKMVIRILGD